MKHISIVFLSIFCINFGLYAQSEKINPYKKFEIFKSDKKWGFKNANKVVIKPDFEYATHFSEGYALVKQNGLWGYIDTLGNWFIQAQFDKAQPIINGLAYVEKKDKIGIIEIQNEKMLIPLLNEVGEETGEYVENNINNKWFYLIEPNYDEIKEYYGSRLYLFQNGKQGYFDIENRLIKAIPCLYDSINIYNSELISGQKSNQLWDIYFNGELILDNIDQPITYDNYKYQNKSIIVSKNGLKGIYHLKNGWLTDIKYGKIKAYATPAYTSNATNFNVIFALHDEDLDAIDPEWMYNTVLKDSISLIKADGTKLLDKKVNSFTHKYDDYSEIQSPFIAEMSRGLKTIYLKSNFSIQEFNFGNLKPHYYNTYFIATGENNEYILDSKFNMIDSFYRVEKYTETNFTDEAYYDTETGEPISYYDPVTTEVEEPFLIISKKSGDKIEKAVYHLEERKVISPWFPESDYIFVGRKQTYLETLYTFHTENEIISKMAFYIKGMEKHSELKYEANGNNHITGDVFTFSWQEGDIFHNDIFKYKNKKLEFISSDFEVIESSLFNISVAEPDYYDPENLEQVYETFRYPFLILKKNKKYGFALPCGKIIYPEYDTIFPNNSSDYLSNTKKGELYGIVDLIDCYELNPFSNNIMTFNSDLYYLNKTISYCTIFDENPTDLNNLNDYFLSTSGKKFYGRSESIFPRKVKGKYGLYTYSSPSYSKNKNVVYPQVKAAYKFLELSFIPSIYNAQSKNKKWGMINFIGDTVVPFEYSKIEEFAFNGDNQFLLKVFKNKKQGIYDINSGEIVSCIFDEINQIENYDLQFNYYYTKIGKKTGLIDLSGNQILEAKFDNIELVYINDMSYFLAKNEKNKFLVELVYPQPIVIPFDYDFYFENKGYVRKGENFDVYNINSNSLIQTINQKDLELNGMIYSIICKNNKFGAVDLNGKELVPCEYDFATFFDGRDEVMIGIQNGIKYNIYVENNERFTEDQW